MKTENNFEELELAPEEAGVEVTNANDGIMLLCDCPETGGDGGNSGNEDDCPETGGNNNPSTGTSSSNTMSTAYNLTIGTSRSGVISQPYDEQWFKFTANGSSNKYKIYSAGSTDVLGFLYNSSGTQLKQDDDSHGNRNFEINTELTQGATYYIKVKAYSTNTGSFTVIVENAGAGNGAATQIAATVLKKLK